jgi:hypothetical protein
MRAKQGDHFEPDRREFQSQVRAFIRMDIYIDFLLIRAFIRTNIYIDFLLIRAFIRTNIYIDFLLIRAFIRHVYDIKGLIIFLAKKLNA